MDPCRRVAGQLARAGGALLCLVLLTGCTDPGAAPAPGPDAAASTDAGDPRVAQTAAVFSGFDDPDSPGCTVAVRHVGGDHAAAFGVADLDDGEPLTVDSVLDIASVSKQMTAGAIALLVVRGELAMEDDIADLLPDLPAYDEPITVADLVHHTSGLPDYTEALDAEDDEVTTNADALELIADPSWQPTDDPGAVFDYSNTNYLLLGQIVEAVDGRPLPTFLDEEVFEPLDMDPARMRDDQGALDPDQAQGYDGSQGEWEPTGSSWQQTGDGAVHTTTAELLDWAGLFLGEPVEGEGLGSAGWRALMLEEGAVDDGEGAYGGGIGIYDDGAVLSHTGSWIGYSSVLTVLPEEDLAVAVSCNIDDLDADELAEQVIDVWR